MPTLAKKVCPPPAENVVETLEKALERARRGEIRAVAVACVLSDEHGSATGYYLSCGKWVLRDALLGCIERMKFRFAFDEEVES
jgi:hypothetical protein